MKTLSRCCALLLAMTAILLVPAALAQQGPPLSPPATAGTTLAGQTVTIKYSTPSIRGRKIMGGLVPWGEVWRVGANAATTLITPVDLKIGDLTVPAGTYTLFALPTSATDWKLIVSKKTGEWGIPYPEGSDLGRTPMMVGTLPKPQEVMSISFEKVHGKTGELHVKWETTDVWVKVEAK